MSHIFHKKTSASADYKQQQIITLIEIGLTLDTIVKK